VREMTMGLSRLDLPFIRIDWEPPDHPFFVGEVPCLGVDPGRLGETLTCFASFVHWNIAFEFAGSAIPTSFHIDFILYIESCMRVREIWFPWKLGVDKE